MPLGLIVEARLNGAGAGKVSGAGPTEKTVFQLRGRMTLNTAFHTVFRKKIGEELRGEKKREK